MRLTFERLELNRPYEVGEHLACVKRQDHGAYCLFPQVNKIWGYNIKRVLPLLIEHGCKKCGSIPNNYPMSNDPKDGILTSNYVSPDKLREEKVVWRLEADLVKEWGWESKFPHRPPYA
jgi:hypothetical protein